MDTRYRNIRNNIIIPCLPYKVWLGPVNQGKSSKVAANKAENRKIKKALCEYYYLAHNCRIPYNEIMDSIVNNDKVVGLLFHANGVVEKFTDATLVDKHGGGNPYQVFTALTAKAVMPVDYKVRRHINRKKGKRYSYTQYVKPRIGKRSKVLKKI